MTDLYRIQDDADAPEAELRLLRSATLDVPPPHGKARLLTALGVGSVTTAAAAAGASTTTTVVVSKWLAMGALAGALATGSVEAVKVGLDTHRATTPVASSTPGERATVPSLAAAPAQGGAVADEPAAPAPIARRESAIAPQRTLPPAPAPSTLAEEVAALDAARRLLQAGDAASALRALDDYGAAFSRPALAPEARLLRLEVLVALGRREEARRLGERLLASDPTNALAQRVRSLLQQAGVGSAEIQSPSVGH